MSSKHAQQVQWLGSGYDLRIHAFYTVTDDQDFLEALCGHTVPLEKLVDGLALAKCMDCLMKHGTALADEHGDSTDWSQRQ